ncbi:small conductance mechanosensitive ion channel family protein [Cystoisospora suis]|uniref:Small conductance mechanosensitive ion channel family protein n=1 Tax=Cystoisospora suis TaxID=483139 RepID=A0A2C6LE63_9APIC|nr:small conductance mechanosensitive ion channel family protein [Cystoisospora suis]
MDHGSSPGHNPGWAGGHNVSGERYRLSSRDDFPAVHHPPDGGRRVSLRPTHLQGADRESQCHYFPQHHRGLSTVSVMRPIYSHRFVSFRATGEAPSHLGGAAGGGPQPEEEKEEPDSDAEIDDTPKYIRSCLKWFRTVFPVLHPFYWFCGALCFCAMLVLIGLGDGTSPVQKEYMLGVASPGWQPGDTPEATTKPPEVLRDISMQSVLTQGGLAYFYVVCMNMSFWLGFMLLRLVLIFGLINFVCYEMQAATAFTATIDPDIFTVLWSIFCYTLWLNNSGRTNWVLVAKKNAAVEPLMYFRFFGKSLYFTADSLDTVYVSNIVMMILSCRRLLLSLMIFVFELGFLMNMNNQVVAYLSRYSRLRKFNIKWCAFAAQIGSASDYDASDLDSRMDGSVSMERRAFEAAGFHGETGPGHQDPRGGKTAAPGKTVATHTESQPRGQGGKWRQSSKNRTVTKRLQSHPPAQIREAQTLLRTATQGYTEPLRIRHGVSRQCLQNEFGADSLPRQLRPAYIEKSQTSKIRNWLLIHYVYDYPPALFVRSQRIELTHKPVAKSVAEILFNEMVSDQIDVQLARAQSAEKQRAIAAMIGLTPSDTAASKSGPGVEEGGDYAWNDLPPLPEVDPLNPFPEYSSQPTHGNSLRLVDVNTRLPPPATAQTTSDNVGTATTNGRTAAGVTTISSSSAGQSPSTGVSGGVAQSSASAASAAPVGSPGSPRSVSASADATFGGSSGDSAGGGNASQNDASGSPQVAKAGTGNAVSSPQTGLGTDNFGSAGAAGLPQQATGNGVHPAGPPLPEEGERQRSAARSEHIAERDLRGQASGDENSPAEDDSEKFDPLEGDFEFNVVDPQTARLPEHLRTKHYGTHTPFSIAIRPAQSDVAAHLEGENVAPPPQAVAQAPRARRGASATSRRTRLDVGPALNFGEGIPSAAPAANPASFSPAPTHQRAFDDSLRRAARATTSNQFSHATIQRVFDPAERPPSVAAQSESTHSCAPRRSRSRVCGVPPETALPREQFCQGGPEDGETAVPFPSFLLDSSDFELTQDAGRARRPLWKRSRVRGGDGRPFSQSEDSDESKESDEDGKAMALLTAPSLFHEQLRQRGSFSQSQCADTYESCCHHDHQGAPAVQLAKIDSRQKRSRTVDFPVAPDALEWSPSAPGGSHSGKSTLAASPSLVRGRHPGGLPGGSVSCHPLLNGTCGESNSVADCALPSHSRQGLSQEHKFHTHIRSSAYQLDPTHGAELQGSQRDGGVVSRTSSSDGAATVTEQTPNQDGTEVSPADGMAPAADAQTSGAGVTAARASSPSHIGSGNFLSPNVLVDEDFHKGRQRSNAVDVSAVDKKEGEKEEDAAITRDYIEMFLKPDEVEEFMKQVDLAGHGKFNMAMFKRAVLVVYSMRKKLLKALKSQASIASTVRRMISVLLWVISFIVFLLVLGVNINTVIVSGAASLSAIIVALSYFYQNFITAVIFIAVSNPFNVGDRIRVDGTEILYVRKIRTYTTEFETVHGRPVFYSNAVLFNRVITNESRSKNSCLEIPLQVDIRTPESSIRQLQASLQKYIDSRALEFVKDTFRMFVVNVQPGRHVDIAFWMTCVEGWGNFLKVLRTRTDVYFYLIKQLIRLNISFQLPVQPVHLFGPPTGSSSVAYVPSSSGGAKERSAISSPAPFSGAAERRVVSAAAATQQFQMAPSHSVEPPGSHPCLGWIGDVFSSATPCPVRDRTGEQHETYYADSVFGDSAALKEGLQSTDRRGNCSHAFCHQVPLADFSSRRPSASFQAVSRDECSQGGTSLLQATAAISYGPSLTRPEKSGDQVFLSAAEPDVRNYGGGLPPTTDLWQKAGAMVNDALNFVNKTAAAVSCVSSSKASGRRRRQLVRFKSLLEKEGMAELDANTTASRADVGTALSSSYTASVARRLQRQRRGSGRLRAEPLAHDSVVQLRHMCPRARESVRASFSPPQRKTSGLISGSDIREVLVGQGMYCAVRRRSGRSDSVQTPASDGDCSSMTESD